MLLVLCVGLCVVCVVRWVIVVLVICMGECVDVVEVYVDFV